MIQTMRDTIWTISESTSEDIWERMQQYGTETLTARDISFSWQASFDDQLNISFSVKKNLLMAFKEALNNIIKHSEATAVSVKIFDGKGELIIEISDNGKGFDLAAIEKGNGIKNFKNRMEEIGGNATIASVVGEGTKLVFSMKTGT
jgi:signal transduction histidine kinase